jgi:Flp pilus assembly protein TadG
MKGGSVLEGVQQDLRIEADRNVLSKQDVLSVDYHTAYHVMGTKWTSASDNPTNGTLATAGNWSATYDTDLIPMVELIVNSPLDTSAIA